MGAHLGGYVHVAVAVAGLSALFHAIPILYLAVKLPGAAYLIAIGLARLPRQRAGGGAQSKGGLVLPRLLPQFVDPAAAWPVWTQLIAFGLAVNAAFAAADLVYVLTASAAARALDRAEGLQRRIRQAIGGVFVGLGLRLAFEKP